MRRSAVLAFLVVVSVSAGCGDGSDVAVEGGATSTNAVSSAGKEVVGSQVPAAERLLSCGGGLPFPPAAITGPVLAHDDPLFAAYKAFVGSGSRESGVLRLLARNDTEALLSEEYPPGMEPDVGFAPFNFWRFVAEGNDWSYAGNGNCKLQAVVDGRRADLWELDPALPAPTPESTTVHVLVHEQQCASGRPATGRIRPPTIAYHADRVEIAITTDRAPGGQDCQSNPATPYEVELSEPLGERQLLDAGREPIAPPTPIGW